MRIVTVFFFFFCVLLVGVYLAGTVVDFFFFSLVEVRLIAGPAYVHKLDSASLVDRAGIEKKGNCLKNFFFAGFVRAVGIPCRSIFLHFLVSLTFDGSPWNDSERWSREGVQPMARTYRIADLGQCS